MRLPLCRGLCTKHVLAPHLGAHWAQSSSVSSSQCHPAADPPSCSEQQLRHSDPASLRTQHRREAEEDTYHAVGIAFKLLSTCQPMTQHLPGRQRADRFWGTVLEDHRGWHPATRSLPGVTGAGQPSPRTPCTPGHSRDVCGVSEADDVAEQRGAVAEHQVHGHRPEDSCGENRGGKKAERALGEGNATGSGGSPSRAGAHLRR